jgi:SAM-dependent methyltransferase
MRAALLLLAFLLLPLPGATQAAAPAPPEPGQPSKDSVWVTTPERMIRRLLQLADTTKDDVVIDLGAGDGRIPIYAAKHFGSRGVAVELEENLVQVAREKARREGVAGRVRVIKQDLFEADLTAATVVTLYTSPGVMEGLKPKLATLKPGTRIVSHHFTLGDWEPDEKVVVEERDGYLWVVPAAVEGTWRVSIAGQDFRLRLARRYQKLTATAERDGRTVQVLGAKLRGHEIRFSVFDRDGSSRNYTGRLEGGRLKGASSGWDERGTAAWSAMPIAD